MIISNQNSLKINFGLEKDGKDWQIINDDVMGGMSDSKIIFTANSMIFKGDISLQNNGGFASVRSVVQQRDLSKFTKVKIRYKSADFDREYSLVFSTSLRFYNPKYKLSFTPKSELWQTKEFLLKDALETRMGKPTGARISESALENNLRFGFILSDKKTGPFTFEIDYLEFY